MRDLRRWGRGEPIVHGPAFISLIMTERDLSQLIGCHDPGNGCSDGREKLA